MELLIGTTNENKLKQFQFCFDLFGGDDVKLFSLNDLGIVDDVEEDQDTLLDNAKKKAKFFAKKSGLMTLADDLGFFVDALDGAPGIYAKRWLPGSDKDRCEAILKKLRGLPQERRTARYKGALAVYDLGKKIFWEYENEVKGFVIKEFRGNDVFGYDQIFESKYFGKTFAELSREEKAQISHRGQGIKKFLEEKYNL